MLGRDDECFIPGRTSSSDHHGELRTRTHARTAKIGRGAQSRYKHMVRSVTQASERSTVLVAGRMSPNEGLVGEQAGCIATTAGSMVAGR